MRRNPHVPERTADAVALMVAASRPALDALLVRATEISRTILRRIHDTLMQDQAADEALLSGAMPAEFDRADLEIDRYRLTLFFTRE